MLKVQVSTPGRRQNRHPTVKTLPPLGFHTHKLITGLVILDWATIEDLSSKAVINLPVTTVTNHLMCFSARVLYQAKGI